MPTPTKAAFKCLSPHQLVGQIKSVLAGHKKDPAYTLILGAGFSAGIIPTTKEMMHEEIGPWHYDDPEPATLLREPKRELSRRYWTEYNQNNPDSPVALETEGPDKGLPKDVAEAYRRLHQGESIGGLNTAERAHDFMQAMNRRAWTELNGAHFFLGALLAEQRTRPTGRPFCRTLFTTNFDPLLQTSLQLYQQLYFMTDGGELRHDPGQLRDNPHALHLIYAHGLLQRPDLASTDGELGNLKPLASLFRGYFENHGVIVVGSGGWDDCLMEALSQCPRFANNLYWCNRYDEGELEQKLSPKVRALLAQDPAHRFYVPLGAEGADGLMCLLFRALYPDPGLPGILHDPHAGLLARMDGLKIGHIPLRNTVQFPANPMADIQAAPALSPPTVGDVLREVRVKLVSCQNVYLGRISITTTVPVTQSTASSPPSLVDNHTPAATVIPPTEGMYLASYDAYSAGNISTAIALLCAVVDSADASPELRAKALFNRGVMLGEQGRQTEELADYTRIVDALPGAPVAQVAKALFNRGLTHIEHGRPMDALADYDRLIESLPGAPSEQVAKALGSRGWLRYQRGEGDASRFLADTQQAKELDANARGARLNLGLAFLFAGQDDEALAAYQAVLSTQPSVQDITDMRTDLEAALKKWLTPERAKPILALFPPAQESTAKPEQAIGSE